MFACYFLVYLIASFFLWKEKYTKQKDKDIDIGGVQRRMRDFGGGGCRIMPKKDLLLFLNIDI